jgi:acylphosphatase
VADIHFQINGRVQGVGYRAWLQKEARKSGLRGWVRNCGHGGVEALLCGPRGEIDVLQISMRRGPPAANVKAVTRRPANADDLAHVGSGFSVLRDAP